MPIISVVAVEAVAKQVQLHDYYQLQKSKKNKENSSHWYDDESTYTSLGIGGVWSDWFSAGVQLSNNTVHCHAPLSVSRSPPPDVICIQKRSISPTNVAFLFSANTKRHNMLEREENIYI
jgi:hypothetical protein